MKCWAKTFCLLGSLSGALCLTKTWIPSTSLEEPRNWTPDRSSPCGQDTLVFPQSAIASLSSTLAFKKLVLPLSGEIILNEGSTFNTAGAEETCQGQEYEFNAVKKHHWWKPTNWNFTTPDLLIGGQGKIAILDVIPDTDRVPCSFDDVVIPPGMAFRLILDGEPVVLSLTINGQEMNTYSFDKYLSSSAGRRLVEGNGRILVGNGQPCTDLTGCTCNSAMNNDNSVYIREAVGACPDNKCKDPIAPDGFCCPFCCTLIVFNYNDGFQFSSLRSKLQELIKEYPVTCYMSKRVPGSVQAVCVDNADKGTTRSRVFAEKVSKVIGQESALYISKITAMHSVEWPSDQSNSATDAGLVVGLLFSFLFLAVGAGLVVYFYRKKRLPNFDFVRFDRGVTKVEVELGTTPHDDLQPQDDPGTSRTSKGVFYNPIYGKESSSSALERMPDRRENPLYGMDDEVVEA